MDIEHHLADIQKNFTHADERNINLYRIGQHYGIRFGLVCPKEHASMCVDQGGKWIMVSPHLSEAEARVAIMYFLAVWLLTNHHNGQMNSIQQLYASSQYWSPLQRQATELMLRVLMPDSRYNNSELSDRQHATRFCVPVEVATLRRKLADGAL